MGKSFIVVLYNIALFLPPSSFLPVWWVLKLQHSVRLFQVEHAIQAVYSKGGTLFTSTEEVSGQWKGHFVELLYPTNPPSTIKG